MKLLEKQRSKLAERDLRGKLGLPIERDRGWTTTKTLSEHAAEARAKGRI